MRHAFALAALPLVAASARAQEPFAELRVLTQNEYLGADLAPIIAARSPAAFDAAVRSALEQVTANDFPARARALAAQIAAVRPDLVGLQEVVDFTVGGANGAPPYIDHLSETLDALSEQGVDYVVAATVTNLHAMIPFDLDGMPGLEELGIRDRDVVLARVDVPFETLPGDVEAGGLCGVPVRNPVPIPIFPAVLASEPSDQGCNYTAAGRISTPVGALVVKRGFVAVDARVGGVALRFVTTHLEVREPDPTNPLSPILQSLQAHELVGTLRRTTPRDLPLVLVGDFNSSPRDPTTPFVSPYASLVLGGLRDAWWTNLLRLVDPTGFTCCQPPDLSGDGTLAERIDQVWLRGHALGALDLAAANDPATPAGPPNWGSDHAAVFALLRLRAPAPR
jgi:endonuclease/exonuclease/phosphatase family metal-dependent hydrolase